MFKFSFTDTRRQIAPRLGLVILILLAATAIWSIASAAGPCDTPTVISGGGSFNVTTSATCFKYVNTTFSHGGMFTVMNGATTAANTLNWYGGRSETATACINDSQTISGNGAQLNNFTIAKDSNSAMFLTITGNAANTVTISIQNWQNGTGCSAAPTPPGSGPSNTPAPATATRTPTQIVGASNTPSGPTATRSNTPSGPTNTPTRTPTQGSVNSGAQMGYSTQNGGTTGGAGGVTVDASTGTQIHQALCGRASNTTPIIIRVSGTITVGNTAAVSGSCNTQAGVIEIKDVSNVTLIGVGTSAVFDQIGIHIRNSHNIIIQNVNVKNVKKSGTPISNGGDAIGMESNVSNVWVDHCLLEASGGEAQGYDGLFDLKNNTQYVTLSWTILRNSERGGLVNSSDTDNTSNFITYHHNYYQNLHSRTPLLRFATAHSFNNYFNGIVESGMNPRIGGKIKAQNNYFENALNPIGTFYTDDMGFWDVSGNIFASTVTWSTPGTNMHPAGPNVVSTTSISIPYSYTLDPAANVPSIVLNGAGVGKIGN